MNINITFRHMDSSDAIKSYARGKVAKLQKFLRQPMAAKVTLSLDKLRHVAETQISSGGAHLEAKEVSEDMYASIDRVIDKLERQIRGNKGAARAKKRRSGDTLRGGKQPQPVAAGAVAKGASPAPAERAVARTAKKTRKKAAKATRSKR
jgi:putative sigma-54 modulation protein